MTFSQDGSENFFFEAWDVSNQNSPNKLATRNLTSKAISIVESDATLLLTLEHGLLMQIDLASYSILQQATIMADTSLMEEIPRVQEHISTMFTFSRQRNDVQSWTSTGMALCVAQNDFCSTCDLIQSKCSSCIRDFQFNEHGVCEEVFCDAGYKVSESGRGCEPYVIKR